MPYINKLEQREYQRLWIAKRRSDFFNNKSCRSCGSRKELELAHKDRSTKISHKIWSWSSKRRDSEIEKCDVLCCRCHKDETNYNRRRSVKHGSYTMYCKCFCRCDECRLYMKITLAKRKNKVR